MKNKIRPAVDPIMVGIDQSKEATGLIVCRYNAVGGAFDLILNETVKYLTRKKTWTATVKVVNLVRRKNEIVFGVAREQGYFDKRYPDVEGEIERTGGWFEAYFEYHYNDAIIERYLARDWRMEVWGNTGTGGKGWYSIPPDERQNILKSTSLMWAQAKFPRIMDHHQADALGILSCHGAKLVRKGLITV